MICIYVTASKDVANFFQLAKEKKKIESYPMQYKAKSIQLFWNFF